MKGLLAVVALAVLTVGFAQGFTPRATPRGMNSLPTNGSGRVLTTTLSGSASATKLFRALLVGVQGYFDATPRILNALRDPRDTSIQASFRATMNGSSVTGLIALAVQGTKARAVLLFDATPAFAGSVTRLIAVASGGAPSSAAQVKLTRVNFPDGSGSIGLAQGWTLKYAAQGAADIAGPVPGSGMSIGANLIVPFTSSDPAQALVLMAKRQNALLRLTIIDAKPTPWQTGKAAFVRYRTVLNGSIMEYFGLFAVAPYDGNQVFFYTSYLQAPSASFKALLPVGLQIWGSWSVNPAVFTQRLNAAAQSMRETGEILASVNANRTRAFEGTSAGWSEYIRDVATLEDNDRNRTQTDASFAARVVQDNPNGFRIVPPSELVPR